MTTKLTHRLHSSNSAHHVGRALLLSALALVVSACTQNPAIQNTTKKVATKPVKVIQKSTQNQPKTKQINILYEDEHHDHDHSIPRNVGTEADFKTWLAAHPTQKALASEYERYLANQLGKSSVPPMYELLTTARAWQECGYEPYEVPPRELWGAMLPTIRMYNDLRSRGILPANTHIRSVYRSPDLNRCAGGAPSSKHMTNGAMDIWVPNYEVGSYELSQLQNRLCEYWLSDGQNHQFGLGLYATGAIHLDTQGYRKWGAQFSENGSICRYSPPKSSDGL